MADVKDKQFLRGEVRDMVRVGIPAIQKAAEELQARVTVLESKSVILNKDWVAKVEAAPEPKKEAKPKMRSRKKKGA